MVETLREINIGRVTLRITRDFDNDQWIGLDYLGAFSGFQRPTNENEKLVHRATGSILDHHGIWRNVKGEIRPEPEENFYSNYCQYTFHNNGHTRLKYAYEDSRRLDRFNRGDLWCWNIKAEVSLDGVVIGEASLWGIESDSGQVYEKQIAREVAQDALHAAKFWKNRNLVVTSH